MQSLKEAWQIQLSIPIPYAATMADRLYWSDFALAAVEAATSTDLRVRQLLLDIQRLHGGAHGGC